MPANRAVMAETDDASLSRLREKPNRPRRPFRPRRHARPILEGLCPYSDEARLLPPELTAGLPEYAPSIAASSIWLSENTNLKAQRLSYGPALDAADAFRDALNALKPSASEKDAWHAAALIARGDDDRTREFRSCRRRTLPTRTPR